MGDLPRVCDPLIREFYANAVLREHEINCWIRGQEFTIDVDDIDDVLDFEGMDDHDFTHYKDRMLSLETVQTHIGGVREGGDEEEGDQEEGEPMDTEIEAAGEPSSSRGRGKRSKASSSSVVPSNAFQIILERIDELRDV